MDYYIIPGLYWSEFVNNNRTPIFKIQKETAKFQFLEHVGYKYKNGHILIEHNSNYNNRRIFGTILRI
jgi:hypothetical protein